MPLRMDSCTEEEQEDFFETLEVIASSSDGESAGDDNCRDPAAASVAAMAKVSTENPQVLRSRYEVWQNDTSSILERRQRLFTQMGLRLEREDSKRSLVFVETSEKSSPEGSEEKFETMSRNEGVKLINPINYQESGMGARHSLSREGANRTKDPIHDFSSRLGQTSISSPPPAQSCKTTKTGIDESSSFSRSVSSGHNLLTSTHGNKNTIGRSNSVQEGAFFSQFNVGTRGPLADFASLLEEEQSFLEQERVRQNDGFSANGHAPPQDEHDIERFCRIKDLDSGKEFVVNTGGYDGSWNKVKDLRTGRELTLEEFESSVGFSPIVQEVMKRERADDSGLLDVHVDVEPGIEKKKRPWFKAIKGFVNSSRDKGHYKNGSNGRVSSLEKSGRRSSSESNDGRESPPQLAKRVKVHAHRKGSKDFTDLHLRQEIQAHEGAIWAMKFSLDGSFLASAGQDKVVRVWEVVDQDRGGHSPSDKTGDSFSLVETKGTDNPLQCHKHLKGSTKETLTTVNSPRWTSKSFQLSEKPKHAFFGHNEDVLDVAWSQSQFLLSSSMDKTVRLWNVMTGECSRIFAHNDYVTCIHFNPVDDGYFISGSLDGKVRIWSVKDHQVVDWVDLCEMVTAACYTQDGQGAVVGSYKGTCHFYKTLDRKLQFDSMFEVQRKRKKRSQGKKITGFQFVPGEGDKILVTSSDSRIRVYEGSKVCSKYVGLRNSNSQISASFSSNGAYVICASEDSRVCIWRYYDSSIDTSQKQKYLARSYEDFFAQNVSIAILWPGCGAKLVPEKCKAAISRKSFESSRLSFLHDKSDLEMALKSSPEIARNEGSTHEDRSVDAGNGPTRTLSQQLEQRNNLIGKEMSSTLATSPMLDSYLEDCCAELFKSGSDDRNGSHASSRGSSTWLANDSLPSVSLDRNSSHENKVNVEETVVDKKVSVATMMAWGFVIVTAGLGGQIQVFQNQSPPA